MQHAPSWPRASYLQQLSHYRNPHSSHRRLITGVLHRQQHRNSLASISSAAKPRRQIETTHAATFPGSRVRTFNPHPPHQVPTNGPSIISNMSQLRTTMCNKHLLRRARVLRPLGALVHHPHDLHPVRRNEHSMYRRLLLDQRRDCEVHCNRKSGVLQVALRV